MILYLAIVYNILLLAIKAQTTNTVCVKNESNSFLFNANNESPCAVWSKLQSLCLSPERYINVPPLQDRTWGYNPVTIDEKDSLCQCNVVAYALMAGCSWCQVGDALSWVTEQKWRQECTAYYKTSVSFAQSVLPLPPYVFHPWNNNRWDPITARKASEGQTILAPTIATTTLSRSFASVTSTSSSAPIISSSDQPSPLNTDQTSSDASGLTQPAQTGAIVGGVIGGLFILTLIILTIRYWRKQHKFQQASERNKVEYGVNPNRLSRDPYASGPSGGLFGMLIGRQQSGVGPQRGETDRISRWSEGFFINPRKAPDPDKFSKYTTTTERKRERRESSGTDYTRSSSFDVVHDMGHRGSEGTFGMSMPDESGDGSRNRDLPERHSIKQPSIKHPYAMSPGFDPDLNRPHVTSSKSIHPWEPRARTISTRNPVSRGASISKESFADRWSDQSSVFTFATTKTKGTLPSFSTSTKEIKDHRAALANRVLADRAGEEEILAGDRRRGSMLSSREIILGSEQAGRDTRVNKGKTVKKGKVGYDESSVKIKSKKKKKKKKRRSSNGTINRLSSSDTASGTTSALARHRSSILSVAEPPYMPEYIHKPLPAPPPSILLRAPQTPNHSIDFSIAPPLSPSTSLVSPRTIRSSRPLTAQMTGQTVEFPSPIPYSNTRPSSTLALRSNKGRELLDPHVTLTGYSRSGVSSFHPTLPSLYEPKTGAGVYAASPT